MQLQRLCRVISQIRLGILMFFYIIYIVYKSVETKNGDDRCAIDIDTRVTFFSPSLVSFGRQAERTYNTLMRIRFAFVAADKDPVVCPLATSERQ